MDIYKDFSKSGLSLFSKGHISRLMNFTITADSFYSLYSIALTGLDPLKVSVYTFYNYTDAGGNWVAQPNLSAVASPNDTTGGRTLDGGYQISNGLLSIGVVNNVGHTNFVPVAPYSTVAFNFYILTY